LPADSSEGSRAIGKAQMTGSIRSRSNAET
jgi:hypothetical protein